ncbi:MAG: hypothetical protein ACYTF9_09425 [Planctomycetota bacterium]
MTRPFLKLVVERQARSIPGIVWEHANAIAHLPARSSRDRRYVDLGGGNRIPV